MSKRSRKKRTKASGPRSPEPVRASSRSERNPFRLGLAIFAVALLLRGLHFFTLLDSPLFDVPVMDSQYNTNWAAEIARGEGMGGEAFFRAPFYAYATAPFYWLFGEGPQTLGIIRIAQMLLGALNCSLVYLLGLRLFDRRVGALAGFVAAFYWVFIYFEGEFLLPVVLVFHLLTATLFLHRAVTEQRLRDFFFAGMFVGLFAITRPNILICIPPLLVWLYCFALPGGVTPRIRVRSWLVRSALLSLGIGLCIAPVTLRNALVAGDFVLIASQGGVNFYIGNNPQSDGKTAVVPGTRASWWGGYRDTIRIAEEARGRALQPSEVSDYWFEQGIAFLREEPAAAAALYAKKLRLLFNHVEVSNNQNIYFFIHYTGFLGLPLFTSFWMVAPFALAGVVLLPRDRWWWLLNGFVWTYLASFLLFFVTARYRVPVLPFLILFAAAFAVRCADQWREGRWRALALAGGVVVLFGVALAWNGSRYPDTDLRKPSTGHFTLASVLHEKGRLREAIPHLELSARLGDPHRSGSHLHLGAIHLELGDEDAALRSFRTAIGFEDRRWSEVADHLIEQGRVELAEEFFAGLEGVPPSVATLSLKLAPAYRDKGNLDRAVRHYTIVLDEFPQHAEARASRDALQRRREARAAGAPADGDRSDGSVGEVESR